MFLRLICNWTLESELAWDGQCYATVSSVKIKLSSQIRFLRSWLLHGITFYAFSLSCARTQFPGHHRLFRRSGLGSIISISERQEEGKEMNCKTENLHRLWEMPPSTRGTACLLSNPTSFLNGSRNRPGGTKKITALWWWWPDFFSPQLRGAIFNFISRPSLSGLLCSVF